MAQTNGRSAATSCSGPTCEHSQVPADGESLGKPQAHFRPSAGLTSGHLATCECDSNSPATRRPSTRQRSMPVTRISPRTGKGDSTCQEACFRLGVGPQNWVPRMPHTIAGVGMRSSVKVNRMLRPTLTSEELSELILGPILLSSLHGSWNRLAASQDQLQCCAKRETCIVSEASAASDGSQQSLLVQFLT